MITLRVISFSPSQDIDRTHLPAPSVEASCTGHQTAQGSQQANTKLNIVQKPNETDGFDHACVTKTDDNGKVLEKLQNGEAQIGAGTTWLWSREEFADSVDVLLVDEAGQMSLANVLAISPAAKSVVLLGDPQQLDQPQKKVAQHFKPLEGRSGNPPSLPARLERSWPARRPQTRAEVPPQIPPDHAAERRTANSPSSRQWMRKGLRQR